VDLDHFRGIQKPVKTPCSDLFPHLSTVFSSEGVDGMRKSEEKIQQDSEDEIQQLVEEVATTDFPDRWRGEDKNTHLDIMYS
jgi:hypothetical protein